MTGNERSPAAFLVLRISLHEPRYHGQPEWPPAPARVFQALVAGAGRGAGLAPDVADAFRWLELLPPPTIGAPEARLGRESQFWVPNNDLDSQGGDPARISEIRVAKAVEPRLLKVDVPFIYAWQFPDTAHDRDNAIKICTLAEKLYQFGRGVDMAWAVGAVLDEESFSREIDAYTGEIVEPLAGVSSTVLLCPHRGSLDRLVERFEAASHRFAVEGRGRSAVQVFTQPPMVSFGEVEYGGVADLELYELRRPDEMGTAVPWALVRAHDLVVRVRDSAYTHLRGAMPDRAAIVEDVVIGRRPDSVTTVRPDQRVRIVPLPSIGHDHADLGIRRVAIEIPRSNALAEGDVAWAFSRVSLEDPDLVLVSSDDRRMLGHYGCGHKRSARAWRTVTPAALPEVAKRRRIDPQLKAEQVKGSTERRGEEQRARAAVATALRHAGIRTPVRSIRVQREPFDRKGERAEAFASGTRFEKERLWHVEVTFRAPRGGPIVIGDGRFLGLGLMRPVMERPRVLAFRIVSGLSTKPEASRVARALRRAAIFRYQELIGPWARVPPAVLGHDNNGTPTRDVPRISYVFDPARCRLLLLLCGAAAREAPALKAFAKLAEAMEEFTELRTGRSGILEVEPIDVDIDDDPLMRPSDSWRSVTPYIVNRHEAHGDASAAVAHDLRRSCRLQGLNAPSSIIVDRVWSEAGLGLAAELRLSFTAAMRGPVLLGKTRFKGGGLFEASG